MKRFMLHATALLVLNCAVAAITQTSQGRILGTVTDPSGAVVTNVQITVTNTATNVSRVVQTNSAGEYTASLLDPGTYIVTAVAAAFKKTVSSPVLLEVSRDVRVDLNLQPGAINETITVTAEGTLADTTDSTLN